MHHHISGTPILRVTLATVNKKEPDILLLAETTMAVTKEKSVKITENY